MTEKNNYTEPVNDDDFKLWRLLDHTRFMIARSREMELAQYGLTPEQAYVLDILHKNNGTSTINEIVANTMRQHHSISTQINRMTKQGLVNKRKNLDDKRKYDIVLTEKGRNLFSRVTRDSIKKTFSCLSEEEKKELDSHLLRLMERAYNLLRK